MAMRSCCACVVCTERVVIPETEELKGAVVEAMVGRVPVGSATFHRPMTGSILALVGIAFSSCAVTSSVRERLGLIERVDHAEWP